jgi:D-alanyl-D-alanine carboxypeptidase
MKTLLGHHARNIVCLMAFIIAAACSAPQSSTAAPFAAIVQDARTGEVLYSENANTRLHPASLTKMLTLYIAFEEIQRGNISLDSLVTVSKNAASQPPSRLGLKAGQKIALRYLIRAAAIKSANDAASAIGDAIGGNEAKFAERMTRTAKALGMKNSTFKNANGLTRNGHLSTAADMNLLGRRLFYDFPQYYNLFSRRTTDAGMAQVRNTNTRFLDAYEGADGIKTGYTVAAGFNLTASAERGGVRIIATVFGGTSTAQRNSKMAELMNVGFRKAPRSAPTKPPAAPEYQGDVENALIAANDGLPEVEGGAGKTIRLLTSVTTSPRPQARPVAAKVEATSVAVAAIETSIEEAVAEAAAAPPPAGTLDRQALELAEAPEASPEPEADRAEPDLMLASAAAISPPPRPSNLPEAPLADDPAFDAVAPLEDDGSDPEMVEIALAEAEPKDLAAEPDPATSDVAVLAEAPHPAVLALTESTLDAQAEALAGNQGTAAEPQQLAAVELTSAAAKAPPKRNAPIFDKVEPMTVAAAEEAPVVIRLSTSNARHYGVHLGKFNSRDAAERMLLKTQLTESATLNEGLRKVVQRGGGFEANFMGLSQEQADLACRRLQARGTPCFTLAP